MATNGQCHCHEPGPSAQQTNAFIVLKVFGHFIALTLNKSLICHGVFGRAQACLPRTAHQSHVDCYKQKRPSIGDLAVKSRFGFRPCALVLYQMLIINAGPAILHAVVTFFIMTIKQ
jgi:hypothetical protein